jgi:predicted NAD/FAD-dependent oxidoreductase
MGVKVRVFERSSVIGGRCATQLWQGHLVDSGVQYFTAKSGDFKKELLTRLRQFRPIVSPILDQDNHVMVSDHGPRFYVLQGNNYFAHVLSSGLDIRLNTEVGPLTFKSTGVKCLNENYDAVVSAAPAPQTVRLFGLRQPPAAYEPALIALLEYGGTDLGQVREAYGRVLADPKGVLRSSFCENNKVGRIVGNKTVFIVEATARYSREFAETPPEVYLPEMIKKHEEIWSVPAKRRTAAYGYCWKVGHPRKGESRSPALPTGAFICGDSRAESTVESVWLDGQKAAQEVLLYLTQLSS